MKNFSLALLLFSIIFFSFKVSTLPPATPIHYDDDKTGTFVFFNHCTGENVDVTYRSRCSFRGTINGQKVVFKAQLNEQHDGVGQTSGRRYVGHLNQSDNQSGSLVNGRYIYSQKLRVRMISPGQGSNFTSLVDMRFTLGSTGEATSERVDQTVECQ